MSVTPENEPRLLTVKETAARLGQSEPTIRRKIAEGALPAFKVGGARAAWRIDANELERQLAAEAERVAVRQRLAGFATGRGDEGRNAAVDAAAAHVGASDEQRLAARRELAEREAREDLYDYLAREIRADKTVQKRLKALDDDERVEAAAQELARRVREHDRIQERAREIADEDRRSTSSTRPS